MEKLENVLERSQQDRQEIYHGRNDSKHGTQGIWAVVHLESILTEFMNIRTEAYQVLAAFSGSILIDCIMQFVYLFLTVIASAVVALVFSLWTS